MKRINITPLADCKSFQKGDFIEEEVELILVSAKADDYYRPNQNFANALYKNANSWEMVYRQATGNDLEVEASSGCKGINKYPVQIEANSKTVCFSVTGGKRYFPLTITKVNSYSNPVLSQKVNGKWQKVNQEVYGNDFWQTEHCAANGT